MIYQRRNFYSLDSLEQRMRLMSDVTLKEFAAKHRGFEGAVAKRLLRERDQEVGLAEAE